MEADGLTGPQIDAEWTAFAPESGTKAVPRADMPQIKAEHRGAMVQFLKGRGITHEQDAEVDPRTLKPTQAEFSPAKVAQAAAFTGGDRSILVSADGHVLDGHHQWMAKRQAGEPVKVIRLNAPIDRLLAEVRQFPSAEASQGAPAPTTDPFADDYSALVGKTIEQTVTTDDGKTATLRMDAARALRDFDRREKALAELKACLAGKG